MYLKIVDEMGDGVDSPFDEYMKELESDSRKEIY